MDTAAAQIDAATGCRGYWHAAVALSDAAV